MRVLLINPPYQTLTSNLGVGHQVPLGLLMVGGALLRRGHEVRLLDAECLHLRSDAIVKEARHWRAEVVMTSHAGSTPAHPVCVRMMRAIRGELPHVATVYGGVYPTYHAAEILRAEPAIDFIVRGEGEATAAELADALATRGSRGLRDVAGFSFRNSGRIVQTLDRPPIRDLDTFPIGWGLIDDWDRYRCFGLGRAAIIQFSRGCPHRCTYCGQHGFWVKWRRRDPLKLADEIEWLHRTHNVRFITLADENPTTLKAEWRRLLEELARRRLPVHFFATIRATDIVRDADMLDLYRRAGILYVLMGIESTSDQVLREVRKGSTTRLDFRACRLLREHGIFSIMGHIVGLEQETWRSFARAMRQLSLYDGDYLNAMYVTPHDWTPFGRSTASTEIIEPDQSKWDYRHQVLAQRHLRPWQIFLAVKVLELCFHLRPRRLWRILTLLDQFRRRQLFWCSLHIGLVWAGEIVEFILRAVWRSVADGKRPRAPLSALDRVEVPQPAPNRTIQKPKSRPIFPLPPTSSTSAGR